MVVILCYARWSTEWLTGQARVELGHLPFPAGLLPLLIPDLPLRSLVTEDFDLAVGTVDGLVAAVVVAVGVNLQVQRKTLHALLRGEVRTQTIDGDKNLWRENKWRKLDNIFKGLKGNLRYLLFKTEGFVQQTPHSLFFVALYWLNMRTSGCQLWRCSFVLLALVLKTGNHCVNKMHYSLRAFGTTIQSGPWGKSNTDVVVQSC